MLVKKRDGRVESFKSDKILASIKKAALAVEVKDDDIQRRAAELKSLKNQLIEHGFDEIEAEEQAEEQFEGYLDDGVYTEYDEEEAEEVVDMVLEGIDSLGLDEDDLIDTGLIQDFVEKALLTTGHVKTAKEYIIKRANRERIREMNTSLMKSYEDLTFGKSSEVETKRENANIDGDSSMGTMLKYGSEGAKKFNLLYVVPPEESDAHSNGDIHIHDLDFYSLTETCAIDSTKLVIQSDSGVTRVVEAGDFDKYLEDVPVDTVKKIEGLKILSKGQFVNLKNCVRHRSDGKHVIEIKTKFGSVSITDEHKIPIILSDGTEAEVKAKDIRIGDRLYIDGCDGVVPNQSEINLIELFGPTDNIVIYNSTYVLEELKARGLWKSFCTSIGYEARARTIRIGSSRMTLADYYAHVRPYAKLDESKLKLSYRRTRGEESINAVVKLTKELGKFIGYMISEGSISMHDCLNQDSPEKKACFTNYSEELIQDFNDCVSKVFNNPTIRDRYTEGRHTGTHLSGYLAYELFHGPFGFKHSTGNIKLPNWIYSANSEFLSGFLGALIDGDGHVHDNKLGTLGIINYATSSSTLVHELQKLLLLHGIKSKVTVQNTKGTLAEFGDKLSIRNYDTYRLVISSDTNKCADISSFKIQNSLGSFFMKNDDTDRTAEVIGIEVVDYTGYVYDFETENHYFSANGFTVHNCCQIDLEKLFHNGFNTGHGFLREPGEIRSYGALACIAIQSNQNDMHKRVA